MIRPLTVASQSAAIHLLVCPYAGASYAAFRQWRALELPRISASLVIYPGRDERMREPGVTSIQALARELAVAIAARPDAQRCVVLGHSMGAQVAFEACLELEARGQALRGLVLSACQAPHLQPRRVLTERADQDFIEELCEVGGSPAELRTNRELQELFLPMLRADFAATERYRRTPQPGRPKVETSSLLLHGDQDHEARADEVDAWRSWLAGRVTSQRVLGDHFYVTQAPLRVISTVARAFGLRDLGVSGASAGSPAGYFP